MKKKIVIGIAVFLIVAASVFAYRVECGTCGTTGWVSCWDCGGSGEKKFTASSTGKSMIYDCRTCNGRGQLKCKVCNGKGYQEL